MTSLPPLRPYRRTLAGALGGVVVVVAQVVGWPVHRAGAQTAPAFVPGTANATSQAIQLAPSTGGLGYNMTLAESLAGYQDTQGQAQSQTLDLGAIGLALTTQQCNGDPPAINQSQVPQPVQVESNNGNVSQTKTFQGSNNAGAGVESAGASTTPSGTAKTTVTGFSVPGVIDVSGGTSSAEAQLIANKAREATSSSEIKELSLLGGQVVLDGLQWHSTQRSGDGAGQQGSFTLGSMTVAGKAMPVSPGQLPSSLAQANQALAPTGFHITPPTVTNQSDGSVLEGPMSIGIDSSALGQQVLGPGLAAAQPLRNAIAGALLGMDCRAAIPLLLADIGIGPAAGGGGLDINLGGATTVTNGTAYANPFDVNLGGNNSDLSQAGGGGLTGASTAGSDTGLGSPGAALAGQSLAAPAASGPGSGSSGGRPLGAVENTASHPGLGAAVPVGVGALALVLVLAAMDYIRARRRRMFAAAEPGP